MEEISLTSWDKFRATVATIREKHGVCVQNGQSFKNQILFRGQADAQWRLETTLERWGKPTCRILAAR
jgi:hypothetical protein